jgi:DNA polymerase
MAYHLPGMSLDEIKLWHRAYPDLGIEESERPKDLFKFIAAGGMVEAHNALFELLIWNHVAVPQHGWPELPFDQLMCSSAKVAAHALPRSLEGAILALNLPVRKDEGGKRLINLYCKPKRLTTAERELFGEDDPVIFNEDAEGIWNLWHYCRRDVRAEVRLSDSVADLSHMERKVWQITQRMNMRGVLIDVELAKAALDLAAQAKRKLNRELHKITGIEKGSQRKAVKEWLLEHEKLDLADTKAITLEFLLTRFDSHKIKFSKRARRVLEIVKEVNRTSTNKFKRMLECVDKTGRARDLIVYCGAERTGRFAGKGIQVHNLPKGRFAKGVTMDAACADVKTRDLAWCEAIHDDVMNLIASCLRGAIIAPSGRELVTADYSAIEARCVLWEAGAITALKVFLDGGDIYCDMASGIYGRVITKENVKPINAMGSTERDFGKVAILGLGYGMGYLKFLITLRTYNIYLTRAEVVKMIGLARLTKYERIIRRKLFPVPEDYETEKKYRAAQREASLNKRRLTDEREDPNQIIHELALCKYTVDTYRRRYAEVPAMWKAQEEAAIRAVRTGQKIKCGPVVWYVKGRFLKCRLPSGRTLNYCDPEIKMAKTSWGESKPSLRFYGRDQKTSRWVRQASYGGKLVENITQAIARDVMAIAKITLDEEYPEYELLISVHDEIVSEADEGKGDKDEFEEVMSRMPAYMIGCPITAEAKIYQRYRK